MIINDGNWRFETSGNSGEVERLSVLERRSKITGRHKSCLQAARALKRPPL